MQKIEKSGFFQDDLGRSILITQGLVGCTLIAGKQILLRVFVDPVTLSNTDFLTLRIHSLVTGKYKNAIIPSDHIIFESAMPNGPSAGVIIRGFSFPSAGDYEIDIKGKDAYGTTIYSYSGLHFNFKPTMDLRFLVVFMEHPGVFSATADWYADIENSMQRLGSMFPVRDCVSNNLSDYPRQKAGIQYGIGQHCDGWSAGYYACVYNQTRSINNRGDAVYITIEYRPGLYPPLFTPPGPFDPAPGGNSGHPPAPYTDLRRAGCVAGNWNGIEMSAACFAQEIGHNFGLEPGASPHSPDTIDPGHSKDAHIIDPFAFDFINKKPFNPAIGNRFLGDVMNNSGGGAWQGAQYAMFNAYDWEFLRTEILKVGFGGTEINAAEIDVCGPPAKKIVRTPAEFHQLIGSRADGPLWEWTPQGVKPIPNPKPDIKKTRSRNEALLSAVNEFEKAGVEEIYIPFGDEPLQLVSPVKNSHLHLAHEKKEFNMKGNIKSGKTHSEIPH